MVEVKDSLESVTIGFIRKEDADEVYNSIKLHAINKMTGKTIGQVCMEDRLTGVLKEKYYKQFDNDLFVVEHY